MSNTRKYLMGTTIIIMFLLSSCGPTPRQLAVARQIDAETELLTEAGKIENERKAAENAVDAKLAAEIAAQKIETMRLLLKFGGYSAMVTMLGLAMGFGFYSFKTLIPGLMKAATQKALLGANLVYADKSGFFPMIHVPAMTAGNLSPMMSNMVTGETRNLLESKPATPEGIALQKSVQIALLLTLAAQKMPHGNVLSGTIENTLRDSAEWASTGFQEAIKSISDNNKEIANVDD